MRVSSPIQIYLEALHRRCASLRDGQVATYIPELAKADPAWFGIAIATADGHVYEAGDTRQPFTIQSISKPITYGLALEDNGAARVLATVGVEPSGEAFNAISLAPETGQPLNPMINAGAIATASLVAGRSPDDRLARLMSVFSAYAGRRLAIDDEVYLSEKTTGHRNRAIGHLLRNFEILKDDPDGALDLYFRQCSIAIDCRDLALMAATLACGGVNPRTGERAVREEFVQSILSVMVTCGMYDFAGEWTYTVGMPSKSGVGGGILAVLPGQFGIGVFSPPLDARGNSVRGVAVCRELSRDLNLHVLRLPRPARAGVRGDLTLADVGSRRQRTEAERVALDMTARRVRVYGVQGDLGFASLEAVVRRVVLASAELDTAILDMRRVARAEPCAAPLLCALVLEFGDTGRRVALVGAERHPDLLRALEEALAAEGRLDRLLRFTDLDAALEWAEDRLLADRAPDTARRTVALRDHDVCRGLGEAELARLEQRLLPRQFPAGAVVVRAGDPADGVYLLMHGRVSITVDGTAGRLRIATVSPGMVFGELAVIDRSPRTADARADTPIECLVLSAAALDRLRDTDPSIAIHILQNLLRGVHRMVRRSNEELAAAMR
jgi:glutaminase